MGFFVEVGWVCGGECEDALSDCGGEVTFTAWFEAVDIFGALGS